MNVQLTQPRGGCFPNEGPEGGNLFWDARPGEVVDFPDKEGKRLIAAGEAVATSEKGRTPEQVARVPTVRAVKPRTRAGVAAAPKKAAKKKAARRKR